MTYKSIFWIFTILFFAMAMNAQPSYIYEGGDGGGFSSIEDSAPNTLLYKGGNGDGFNSVENNASNILLYKGGNFDGYSKTIVLNQDNYIFIGGNGDGFAETNISGTNIFLYTGGNAQGYAQVEKCEDFIWTGTIGTGWLVSGNWNYNVIPTLKRRVIVPAGTPFHPALNAGLFSIGENPNNGQYKCGELWIQEGALLVTRVNNRIENYGNIQIDGTMLVRKTTADAFKNLDDGTINISSTGSLMIKP